jgi:hypothetical protein
MDRRNNNEAAGNLTDEQFRKALEVIIDSYKGASADRLYHTAIGCFTCLMEISHNTEVIMTFARRHDIDLKYLVDGANFVISRMHFNPENNYYITLGLSQHASQEEIRERWKRLMLLYHPDRHGGDDSWVSERAKKVNEAYSVLKDNEKRQSFDRRLLEQTIARNPLPRSGTNPSASSSRSGRKISDPEWDRRKKNIPKFLVGAYVVAALVFLSYLYLQNNGEFLEKALSRQEGLSEQPNLLSRAPSGKENPSSNVPVEPHHAAEKLDKVSAKLQSLPVAGPASKEQKTEQRSVIPATENTGLHTSPAAPPAQANMRNATRQQPGPDKIVTRGDSSAKTTAPLLLPPATNTPLNPQAWTQEPESRASVPPVKNIPAADLSAGKPEAPRLFSQETPPVRPGQDPKAAELTHEEIEDFMAQYSRAYTRGDLNLFMSLFSKSVVENNRLRYNAVREAYRETFSERIKFYKVNNMTLSINGLTATVSGSYDLNRYASPEDRWIRYTGRIQWKIAKENNELKIISVNYDK